MLEALIGRILTLILVILTLAAVSSMSQLQYAVYNDCGGTLTRDNGLLASPGYPGLYENNMSCQWTIYSVSGQALLLRFGFCDLENDSDTIEVYREPFDTRNLVVSVNAANWDILWNGPLQVQFTTDQSGQRSGFWMLYRSVSTDCGMQLQDSGNFSSPGFTKDVYPPNVACVYQISSSRDALAIDFTTIDLESCCDKISVYKGKTISYDKLIATLPAVRSARVFVPEPFAAVLFTTDGSTAGSGFFAYFTSEALPVTGSSSTGPNSQATNSHFGPTMETTAVLSTTMQMATTQTISSTTVQLTTPAVRIPQAVVDITLIRLAQENLTVQTVEKVAEQLVNVTTNAEVLSLSSAIKATKIVANISEIIFNSNFTKELYPVPKLIGQIAAGLMNLNSTDLASVESQSKVSVQQSLETSLSVLALAAMQNGSTINETYLKLQDDNLAFQVVINTSISGIRISSASSLSQALLETVPYESALISSGSSSPMQSKNETLVQMSSLVAQSPKTFLVYNSAKLFQAKDGLQPDNNGRVVSAQLPGNTIKAPELIKIVFPPMLSNLERKCGYWNYSAKAWSTEGCNSVLGNDSSLTCTCEHLTNVAVLLAVNNVPSSLATTTQTISSTTVQLTTPAVRIPPSVVAKTLDRLAQENLTVQTVEKIAEQLVNVTTNAEVLSLSSAIKATKIVANISEIIFNSNFTKELYPVPKLIGQIAAGLMNLNSTDLASVESQSKVSVQQSLETSLSVLALAAMQNGSTINETYLKLQDDNLAFQVFINTSISGIRISSASSLSQALLETVPYESAVISSASSSPMQSKNETLVQLSSLVAQSPKTFLVYNSAKLFQAKDGLQPDNNGRVVSAQLPGNTIKAPELIKIVFPPMLSNLERKCGYWNYSAKAWSTEGCNAVIGNDSSVTCTCEHLTNFAVLLAVNNVPSSLALDILSTIGLSLSCLSLAAVVITFLAIKKMRRTVSQKVLFNLALSLLILDLLFLFGIDKTSSRNGCIAIAALLHYFLLTSFMWMLMESILQYLRFVKVLGTYIPRFLPKTVVPAWGVPAVIVAIVSGVDVGLYDGGEKLYCMAQKQVVYYAVLLPIGIILVINWAIFIVVLKSFCCHRRLAYQSKQAESRLAQLHAQAGVAVCTLLGLTWVFGFLTAIPDATTSVAFQWLFCICNTLQGFVIFLFHCLRENALRKELRRLCCRTGLLAATSQSEDSLAASNTGSSIVSRSHSVSMATTSSSSIGGISMLSLHKGLYNFSDAELRTRGNTEEIH